MTLRSPAARAMTAGAALLAVILGAFVALASAGAAQASASGSLVWALDSSFRAYVTGAGGTVAGSSGASDDGTVTTFPLSGSTIDASYAGTASFAGTLTFDAYGGALHLSFADPAVRITGPTTAAVEATVASGRIDLATVDLATATVTSSGGVVTFAGATTTLTSAGSTAFGGTYPAGRMLAPLTFSFPTPSAPSTTSATTTSATTEAPTPSATPSPTGPSVTVDRTTGLNGAGDTITVTGTGFLPDPDGATTGARPPLAGKFTGVYVIFGKFADTWRPSEGATSAARKVGSQKWAVNAADMNTIGGAGAGAIELRADGSFTAVLSVSDALANAGNWGVYTYAAGGAVYAPYETFTPLTFAPRVTVTPTSSLDATGTTLTVTGKNFAPHDPGTTASRPPLAGHFGGVYVAFGAYADTWQPSAGAARTTRTNADVKWFVDAADVDTVGGAAAGAYAIGADGSFTTTLHASTAFTAGAGNSNYGVVTYLGGGTYAPFETFTPVTFAVAEPSPSPTPSASPTTQAPATGSPSTTVGRLTWGVDSDFRAYITGPIAQGAISVSGASSSGGNVTFVQSAGAVDLSTWTGEASYSGSVTFTGHAGALNITIANPSVRLTGPGTGVLEATVGGSRVDFATLNLAAGSRSASGDAVRFTAVPATLTSAGAGAFAGFYPAGRALDPVTVTFGAASSASGSGKTVVTAAYTATTAAAPVPATPPATTGIELDDAALAALAAGQQVTVQVGGFQPGETGIRIVLYSTPTVLAENLTADDRGVVTWTGALPAGLSGTHTLTVQGSVSKGIQFTAAAIPGSCAITDASIAWGFKEAFRAYLESTIANGGWELAGGTTEKGGIFTWAKGSGSIEPSTSTGTVAFAGSVRFTGHEGVLDTTIANPRLVLNGAASSIVVDVSGTTQAGAAVNQAAVSFATVDLSAATISSDADTVTFADAPVTLSAEGASAFGTYPEGEPLDALTLTVTGADGCALPLAGEQAATPSAEPTATVETTAIDPADDGGDGLPAWLWALLGVAVTALVGGIVVWRVRR